MPIPIVFDCDPGIDDAVMLLMAMASPEVFNILGVTTVGGNVRVELVNHNACQLVELAKRNDIGVYSGCTRPLVREPSYGSRVHGETGIQGSTMPPPVKQIETIHAVQFIIQTIKNSSSKITLSVSGPMTNIAAALVLDSSIAENIGQIVCMGGTTDKGNFSKYAEFNFHSDPHAAHVVFSSGIPIRMIGTLPIDSC